MELELVGSTSVGTKRSNNEDSFLLLADERLAVVADGMGGHSSGEIASGIAVTEMADFFRLSAQDPELTWPYKLTRENTYEENRLINGIRLANIRIFERAASEPQLRGMGTTIVAAHFADDQTVVVSHVGDSRLYLFRNDTLNQITEDHSLLNDYLRTKRMTPEEIEAFPHKNVIVRALGMRESVEVDLNRIEPQDQDIFLLCSDGLSGMITDDQICQYLRNEPELEKCCNELITAANMAGGLDNITCVLGRVHVPAT